MYQHFIASMILVCMLVIPAFAHAGGWAVITLDAEPVNVRPDQPFTIGFMVRQHGVTPNGSLTPVVSATNSTGDTITAQAQPQGAEGHYVATLRLPVGTWAWQIDSYHLMAQMGTLEVQATTPSNIHLPLAFRTWWLWLAGTALVVLGGITTRQRHRALA